MRDYAVVARRHWETWLPERFRAIADPARFFAELGREVEREIEALALVLEGPDRPGESYLERVGRLGEVRRRAEEVVLAERVLLVPEPETSEPIPASGPEQDPGLVALVVAPGDPGWAEIVDEETRARQTLRRRRSPR